MKQIIQPVYICTTFTFVICAVLNQVMLGNDTGSAGPMTGR